MAAALAAAGGEGSNTAAIVASERKCRNRPLKRNGSYNGIILKGERCRISWTWRPVAGKRANGGFSRGFAARQGLEDVRWQKFWDLER